MSFKTLSVHALFSEWRPQDTKWFKFKNDETYAVIFGPYQMRQYRALIEKAEEDKKIKILYDSLAVNGSPEHGGDTKLRQRLVIFEYD